MDKLGRLMRTQQEYQEGNHFFIETLTPLYSALRLYGQTELIWKKHRTCIEKKV